MNRKAKGIGAERELIHLFWQNSWAAVRVAGSGSMRHPSPDIIASNNKRKIVIECKATKSARQYLTKEEISELQKFSKMFGAETWIGIRFSRDWFFLSIEDIRETGKNFAASSELAKQKGLTFNELIGIL